MSHPLQLVCYSSSEESESLQSSEESESGLASPTDDASAIQSDSIAGELVRAFEFSDCNISDDEDAQEDSLSVLVNEVLDPNYGLYVWPSAVCLAQHLWNVRASIRGSHIVELGAGTGLPGVLAALMGASSVVLTDLHSPPRVLANLAKTCALNGLLTATAATATLPTTTILPTTTTLLRGRCSSDTDTIEEPSSARERALLRPHEEGDARHSTALTSNAVARIVSVTWAEYTPALIALAREKPDIIIGADVFYDTKLFDDLCATIHLFFRHNPACRFIVAYHDRGSELALYDAFDRWDFNWTEVDADDCRNVWIDDGCPGITSVRLFVISRQNANSG